MTTQLLSARFAARLGLVFAALFLAAGPALAQQAEKNPPRAKDSQQKAAIAPAAGAITTNARMAALIQAGGTIIKQKNVAAVSHPQPGVYCIKPAAAAGITIGNSIVLLTVEFFYSNVNEVQVQWAQRGSPCPTDRFAVYTLSDFNLDARYRLSDDAGFSIVVP